MADSLEGKNLAACKYYVEEWRHPTSFGALIRGISEGTGLSMTETLLYLNWLERFAQTNATKEQTAVMAELAPLQKKVLTQHLEHECDCGEGDSWKP